MLSARDTSEGKRSVQREWPVAPYARLARRSQRPHSPAEAMMRLGVGRAAADSAVEPTTQAAAAAPPPTVAARQQRQHATSGSLDQASWDLRLNTFVMVSAQPQRAGVEVPALPPVEASQRPHQLGLTKLCTPPFRRCCTRQCNWWSW